MKSSPLNHAMQVTFFEAAFSPVRTYKDKASPMPLNHAMQVTFFEAAFSPVRTYKDKASPIMFWPASIALGFHPYFSLLYTKQILCFGKYTFSKCCCLEGDADYLQIGTVKTFGIT
ncbi:hypothetical protein QE152_g35173 [Popillia japonica]|uniref:Uncharacterized protein n=1 Tax=Popillia japonica TaxID=7064 RepID=A0AAW1IGC9_POPJA